MELVHSDTVVRVEPGTTPDYNRNNPLNKLLGLIEQTRLAVGREWYITTSLQYLFPITHLSLYGPAGGDADVLDPARQDNKLDFQKQNVRDFLTADVFLTRGFVSTGDNWTGCFLRISYRGGGDSRLAAAANGKLGDRIKVWLRAGNAPPQKLVMPYNPLSNRYEVELWGYPGADLGAILDQRGKEALARGELLVRNDLVHGTPADFRREGADGLYTVEVAPDHSMHPVLPWHLEMAFADDSERFWDSQSGANYHFEFNMIVRGWTSYLGVGLSPNPHGGVGTLEYRNLLSNYGRYAPRNELARALTAWNFNAYGSKDHGNRRESFMAVDYMDLHIVKPSCGIGLHRHRDNQEIFFLLNGRGLMVVGDFCKMPTRERCFEVRTLVDGHFAMLKGGNLHALMNPTDEDTTLFMFGGYD